MNDLTYWQRYYRDNKASRRAIQKLSVAKNSAHYAAYQAAYYRQNWASAAKANAKMRAKKRGVPFELRLSDIPPVPQCCPVLGIPLVIGRGPSGAPTPNSPSLDCFVPSLGYVPGNVRVISYRANTIKQDASAEELEAVAKYVRGELDQVF